MMIKRILALTVVFVCSSPVLAKTFQEIQKSHKARAQRAGASIQRRQSLLSGAYTAGTLTYLMKNQQKNAKK